MIKHFSNFNGMDRHHIFEAQVDKKDEGIDKSDNGVFQLRHI